MKKLTITIIEQSDKVLHYVYNDLPIAKPSTDKYDIGKKTIATKKR